MQEYPKMMYRGAFNPTVGLGPLQKVTVASPKEEKAQASDGFVTADRVESLIPKPTAQKPQVKKSNGGEQ